MLKQRSNRLAFEVLESRNLLAVTAAVIDGDLVVNGDAGNDTISITFNAATNQYTVLGAGGTLVNGVANGAFVTPPGAVNDDFLIRMGGGMDTVTMGTGAADTPVPDELSIRMGGGVDALTLTRVRVGDDTDIFTNGGNDAVTVAGSRFNDDFDLNANGGSDAVTITSSGAIRSRFEEDVEIHLGDGTNTLAVVNSDFLDDVEVSGGAGVDTITVTNSFFDEDVEMELGAGNDLVTSATSTYNEEVEIDGGAGTDTVTDANGNRFNDELELESVEVFNPGNSFFDEIEF